MVVRSHSFDGRQRLTADPASVANPALRSTRRYVAKGTISGPGDGSAPAADRRRLRFLGIGTARSKLTRGGAAFRGVSAVLGLCRQPPGCLPRSLPAPRHSRASG